MHGAKACTLSIFKLQQPDFSCVLLPIMSRKVVVCVLTFLTSSTLSPGKYVIKKLMQTEFYMTYFFITNKSAVAAAASAHTNHHKKMDFNELFTSSSLVKKLQGPFQGCFFLATFWKLKDIRATFKVNFKQRSGFDDHFNGHFKEFDTFMKIRHF